VNSEFPIVGVIGAGQNVRMMITPATALGIKLLPFASSMTDSAAQITPCVIGDYIDIDAVKKFAEQCDVVTFEHELVPLSIIKALEVAGVRVRPGSETFVSLQKKLSTKELKEFDYEISVLVARSPHAQAATWAPTQIIKSNRISTMTISPAPMLSHTMSEDAQKTALEVAAEVNLIGVMAVEIGVLGNEMFVTDLSVHPHNSGYWTIEGSRTSQFEQHLRAILDLPLGDPSMTNEYAVLGNIFGKNKTDMYRPYLHLMARNPSLKFHLYGKEVQPGINIGHVNATGNDLSELRTEIEHAVDYMSGEIDE
jgi:phosphoribosylaminoimidazole carboxylase (NCAIR synthetase)